jgi:hypothetical protein
LECCEVEKIVVLNEITSENSDKSDKTHDMVKSKAYTALKGCPAFRYN